MFLANRMYHWWKWNYKKSFILSFILFILESETTISIASTSLGGCSPVIDDVTVTLKSTDPACKHWLRVDHKAGS